MPMMALRQMLGVAYLAFYVTLATAMATRESDSSGERAQSSSSILFLNSTMPWTSSSSPISSSSTSNAPLVDKTSASPSSSSPWREFLGTSIIPLEHPQTQTSNIVPSSRENSDTISVATSGTINASASAPYPTTQHISVTGRDSSSPLPSGYDKALSVQLSMSSQASGSMTGHPPATGQFQKSFSSLPSSRLSPGPSGLSSGPASPAITKVGNSGEPSGTHRSMMNGTRAWLDTQSQESGHVSSSRAMLGATAANSGGTLASTMPLATTGPGSTWNSTGGGEHMSAVNNTRVTSLNITSSMSANTTLQNSTSSRSMPINPIFTSSTWNGTTSNDSTLHASIYANVTLANATVHNATLMNGLLDNPSLNNSRRLGNSSLTNYTTSLLTIDNSTSVVTLLNSSLSSNSTLHNTTPTSSAPARTWFIQTGNLSIAVPFQPMHPTLRSHARSAGSPSPTTDQSLQCSGTVTKDIQKLTKTIIATTVVFETTILYGNASTPLPEFIPPHPACSTTYLPFGLHRPGGSPETTSTLLVTKKSPVVIRAPQSVGPIYNIPTSSAQAAVEQAPESPNQAGAESANGQPQVDPAGEVRGKDSDRDRSPGSAPLRQVHPEERPAALPDSRQSSLPQVGSGSSGVYSSSNGVHQPGEGQGSGNGGLVNGGEQGSGGGIRAPSGGNAIASGDSVPGSNVHKPDGGQTSGGGGATINGAQGSGSDSQAPNEEAIPNGAGPATSGGQASGSSNQIPSGGQASGDGSQTSNQEQTYGSSNQIASGGQAFGDGSHTSNQEQTSGSGGQVPNGNQKPKSEGQRPNGGQTVDSGDQGGEPTAGSRGTQSDLGRTSPGQASPKGAAPDSQNAGSSTSESSGSGRISNGGSSVAAGSNAINPDGTSQEGSGDAGLHTGQYVPESLMIDSIPVWIGSSAIVVGSQTFSIGSPATTIVANGQSITIEPSQIIASGTSVPIKAAVTTPPATSTMIGGVPVVLQPNDIMIGSQTFSHGSSAAFAIYNGQTYSWDAKQFVGPGGTMVTFPSATPVAPRITAGGQVFSVYSSTLKASGTDIAIPNSPKASPFVYQGQTFTVNPSQLMAPDRSITIPPISQPTPFVYNGQTFSVDESRFIAPSATMPLSSSSGTVRYGTQVLTIDQTRIICPSTTITLSNVPQAAIAATLSAITAGGLTFSLGPQAAVIGASTYSFLPGQAPATVTDLDQTVTIGSSGVQLGGILVPLPTNPPSPATYSAVTRGDLTFSVAPSAVVLGSQTDYIQPGMAPIHTVVGGQTITIGNQGVALAGTTIPLPTAAPSYATVTAGDLTFSVAPSEAVFKGSTFAIGPNTLATMFLEGQTVSIGPSGIHFPGTTVDLPTVTSQEIPVAVTADGLTFSVGPTDAVIGGTSYAIGSGAIAKTIVVGSKTLSLGASGVILPSTTVPPEQTPSAITADGLTFSADATEAIISGTAYAIGSEAIAKTIVIGSETIGLGTKGIVLPSTTIAPWGNATQTGLSSTYGTAPATGNSPAGAGSAAPPPTGLPATEPKGTETNVHQGAGVRLRPPDLLVLEAILGALCLILLGLT